MIKSTFQQDLKLCYFKCQSEWYFTDACVTALF